MALIYFAVDMGFLSVVRVDTTIEIGIWILNDRYGRKCGVRTPLFYYSPTIQMQRL